MARPPATPEQRRQARELLRHAANDLVAEHGPSGVTVRKVAAKAGVSVGTVYSHFESLSELMRSLWTPVIDEAGQKLIAIADAHPDALRRIRAILHEYVALALGNEQLHRNTLLFVRPTSDAPPSKLSLDELPFHRLLVEAVEEGQQANTIVDGDPTKITQMLWAGVHGALGLPVNADPYDLEPADEQASLMIDTLISAISLPSAVE